MVDFQKTMFSRTMRQAEGKNLRVENGPLVAHALIDEFNLFVHPTAIGNGMRIFGARTTLELSASRAYP